MAESIYTVQTPGNTDASNPGGITLCTLFTSAVNGTVTNTRWFFPVTNPASPPVCAIYAWTGDGTPSAPLATKTWSGTMPSGTWGTFPAYDTPVPIVAGQYYYTAVFSADRFVSTLNQFLAGGITNGNLTAPQTDTITPRANGRFATDPSISYPNLTNGGNGYFVDVLFTAGTPTVSGAALANLGALTGTVIGLPIVLGNGVTDLGRLTGTALGSAPIVPGSAVADLGPLTAHATAAQTVSGTATADLGRLTAHAEALPDAGPTPIQRLTDIAEDLLACLCAAAERRPRPPQHCCFRVGDEVAHDADMFTDLCCEGLAYVSVGEIYPVVDSFPEQSIVTQADQVCSFPSWAVNLKAGIVRCAPVGTDLAMPTCSDWNSAAFQNMYDAQSLASAVCCFKQNWLQLEPGLSVVIGPNATTNPQGGCMERYITIQVQTTVCPAC